MFFRKKSKLPASSQAASTNVACAQAEGRVSVEGWETTERVVRRPFPGPRGATALLRVALERAPYAELIAHAKESLEKEICGVLAGTVCEDQEGVFVHVAAVIRGAAAAHGSTHVTFTQETWNHIHQTLDREFPKLQIVGWYHSHPGFGVKFSEMDLFIQKNFFSGPTQFALVIDPLSGAVAICLNTPSGIQNLERFWVDGREQTCQAPKGRRPQPDSGAPGEAPLETEAALRALDARLGQLIQIVDEQRASHYRFLVFIGIVICAGVVVALGYTMYSNYRYRNEPPRMTQYVPIPVQVGDKTVLVGVGVAQWQVPPELNAIMLTLEREKRLLDEKAALGETNNENASSNLTNASSNSTNAADQPKP